MVQIMHATREDTRRHKPEQDDPFWQESFFLGWCDIRNRCGGSHHISLCPHLNLAHVWSWLIVDGKPAGRSQQHTLPLPDHDLRDMQLGCLHFVAGESVRELKLGAAFESAQLDLRYEAYCDPVEFGFNADGIVLCARHYESMGRVCGTVALGNRQIEISGSGWQDHSWGQRKFTSNPAGRWLFAAFGDDLAFSVFSLTSPSGTRHAGYALDAGIIYPVTKTEFRAVVADDGLSPMSCAARVWTERGRGYRIVGEVDATALTGGPGWAGGGTFFAMDGLSRFECGGRLGEGILEVSEVKELPANYRKELSLPD